MKDIISSIRTAIANKNWYSALFTALTLPDICVALESGLTTGAKYSEWFESNLNEYRDFLSGNDCYALRCSLLHQGRGDITGQRLQDVLEHYVFLTSGTHLNLFKDCSFEGVKKSFLQLNVSVFCEDICIAAEKWLDENLDSGNVQSRLKDTLKIHEPGYTYRGFAKFG